MEIISRVDARKNGYQYYYSGKECKKGHLSERLVSNNCCRRCRAEYLEKTKEKRSKKMAEYRANNEDMIKQKKRDYYLRVKSSPQYIAKRKRYQLKTKDDKKEYDRMYREENRSRVNKRSKDWSKRNPEIRSIISRSYKARRRIIEKGGDSTKEIYQWVKNQDKVCYWCGIYCENSYHIDHYNPLSRGGSHTIGNLVISCPSCNLKKNAKDPYEFAKQVGRLF